MVWQSYGLNQHVSDPAASFELDCQELEYSFLLFAILFIILEIIDLFSLVLWFRVKVSVWVSKMLRVRT